MNTDLHCEYCGNRIYSTSYAFYKLKVFYIDALNVSIAYTFCHQNCIVKWLSEKFQPNIYKVVITKWLTAHYFG